MRAWLMDSFEGTDALRLGDVRDPRASANTVVLRVRFAALNPADAFLAQGLYPAHPAVPHILGREAVGVVLEGDAIPNNIRVGDTVGILGGDAGVETWGTLAEEVAISANRLVPIPAGWSAEEAAGAPLVFQTAWQALSRWSEPPAPPPRNAVLLVTGASGGVGTASVLLGRSMGLVVIALSRSEAKAARLKVLGADFVFDPGDPHLRERLMAAIEPRRVDLVVDTVGGALFSSLVSMLGYAGRISVVGRSAGVVPNLNTGSLFFRRLRIGGVLVSDYTPEGAHTAWKEIVERMAVAGERPVVDSIFPFEDVKLAFDRLKQGPMGKVLVRIAG